MKLTKYGHACFTVEKDNHTVVVDPGVFSDDFIVPSNVVAVIITHEHPDHFDKSHLQEITTKNPDAVIVSHEGITAELTGFTTKTVHTGETIQIEPFEFMFFGGEHALIHTSVPQIANLGVLIDERIYYPGDSFVTPSVPVEILAIPTSAPWLKISEAMDFLAAIHPRLAFSTHDALSSEQGMAVSDRWLSSTAITNGIEYTRLDSAHPLDI
ncbi:MAG TPA: MBL fold metallo-hydrolase [Candidatus Saccharimonadales bacterium]|nr:MBL fold metallo-hydrolase [Candidatus Saccharimonadales bacterium]